MRVECNQCKALFEVADALAGSHVKCVQCDEVVPATTIGIPQASDAAQTPPPRPKAGATGEGSGLSRLLNYFLSLVAGLALLAGAAYFVSDGRVLNIVGGSTAPVEFHGVEVLAVHSVGYETRAGEQLLVVFGEVKNGSPKERHALYAVANLVSAKGKVVATGRAPLGAALGAVDLAALTDEASLQAALVSKMDGERAWFLKAGANTAYTVIIRGAPANPKLLQHKVTLEKGEPLAAVEQPSEPTAAEVEQPANPTVEEEDPVKGKRKGRKGKRKKKRGKAKSKS